MTTLGKAPPRYDAALERTIREEPTGFGFFQLVRLLSRMHPERARVGSWSDPASEVVRFHASTSLSFPASEIQSLTFPKEGYGAGTPPVDMTVNFFGLTGPQGVLPHLYTQHAANRARARDGTFRAFLDLFNHRALSLFFRAWEKHKATVAHESGAEDRLFQHLLDLSGFGTEGMRGRLPIGDEALAYFSGLLATRARSADGLARLIGDYFGVPSTVEQFVGEWRPLDAGGQCALDDESSAGRLGFGVLGDAIWEAQARVRVRLGPLSREQFESFVPGGDAHEALCTLARLFADDLVGVDAQLVLARREVMPCVLGATSSELGAKRGPGLGRGTWLASKPLARDPDETTLRLC